jgi:hypothetical protein
MSTVTHVLPTHGWQSPVHVLDGGPSGRALLALHNSHYITCLSFLAFWVRQLRKEDVIPLSGALISDLNLEFMVYMVILLPIGQAKQLLLFSRVSPQWRPYVHRLALPLVLFRFHL